MATSYTMISKVIYLVINELLVYFPGIILCASFSEDNTTTTTVTYFNTSLTIWLLLSQKINIAR